MNCAKECTNLFPKEFTYLKLNMSDIPQTRIIEEFENSIKFIEEAKENNSRILIHCQIGKSRSPTVVIAYLMKTLNLKSDDAFKMVKNCRKLILPNISFMKQLKEFESLLEKNK